MLTVKEQVLLLNIIKRCEKIETKAHGLTKKKIEDNEDVVEIVCFNIFQIGELANWSSSRGDCVTYFEAINICPFLRLNLSFIL